MWSIENECERLARLLSQTRCSLSMYFPAHPAATPSQPTTPASHPPTQPPTHPLAHPSTYPITRPATLLTLTLSNVHCCVCLICISVCLSICLSVCFSALLLSFSPLSLLPSPTFALSPCLSPPRHIYLSAGTTPHFTPAPPSTRLGPLVPLEPS